MEFAANCIYLVFFGIDKDISVATEDNLRQYTTEFIQDDPFYTFSFITCP